MSAAGVGVGYLPTVVNATPDLLHGIRYDSIAPSGLRNTTVEISGTLGAVGLNTWGRIVSNSAARRRVLLGLAAISYRSSPSRTRCALTPSMETSSYPVRKGNSLAGNRVRLMEST